MKRTPRLPSPSVTRGQQTTSPRLGLFSSTYNALRATPQSWAKRQVLKDSWARRLRVARSRLDVGARFVMPSAFLMLCKILEARRCEVHKERTRACNSSEACLVLNQITQKQITQTPSPSDTRTHARNTTKPKTSTKYIQNQQLSQPSQTTPHSRRRLEHAGKQCRQGTVDCAKATTSAHPEARAGAQPPKK